MYTYRVELANGYGRINGRLCATHNLYGVMRLIDGRSNCWVLPPQRDEILARAECERLNRESQERAA